MKEFDFVVIGGGSAGYAAARTGVESGMSVAVIDGAKELGGLCILRGCMPSKAIIESANRFLTLRDAATFGLHADNISADAGAIIRRKRELVIEFADYRIDQLEAGKFQLIRGHARFQDEFTLQVHLLNGERDTIKARSFLVATGSEPAWPDVPGLREAGCITSDEALELEHIPESITVLGGGPVALELAHYFAALGSMVHVIQRSGQVLKSVDPDVAKALEGALRARGIEVLTNTHIQQVSPGRIELEHEGRTVTIESEMILQALGRVPHSSSLQLERAGVGTSNGRIVCDTSQRTTIRHIFAAGDVCGPHEIVHIAITQGEIAARNAARHLGFLGSRFEEIDYRLILFACFTEPQVAVVGKSEAEAREAGLEIETASYPFDDHGKSMIMGEMHGFVKLMVEKNTRRIIGGSVVGPHASDLIHEIVVAMAFNATAGQLAAVPHYHPTLSEIWTYPAEDLA